MKGVMQFSLFICVIAEFEEGSSQWHFLPQFISDFQFFYWIKASLYIQPHECLVLKSSRNAWKTWICLIFELLNIQVWKKLKKTQYMFHKFWSIFYSFFIFLEIWLSSCTLIIEIKMDFHFFWDPRHVHFWGWMDKVGSKWEGQKKNSSCTFFESFFSAVSCEKGFKKWYS